MKEILHRQNSAGTCSVGFSCFATRYISW